MKLDAIEKKLSHLESRFFSRQVRSTDDDGHEVWIKGSGLGFMREVLKAERELGGDVRLEALPKDLQREVRLWNRAELSASGLTDMIKEICRGLIDEAGSPEEKDHRPGAGRRHMPTLPSLGSHERRRA